MLKLRILSDLHTEFSDLYLPTLDTDKDSVLVLAGDIGLVHKNTHLHDVYMPFLSRCSAQFRNVILINGNHEHYSGSFVRTSSILRGAIADWQLFNVVHLEKETWVIDNVAFIGATLWTDCDRQNPHSDYLWNSMSDSKVIRTGPNDTLPHDRKFLAADTWMDHRRAKEYIWKEVDKHKAAGNKTVVVTHHAVTPMSIHEQYKGDSLNMFFSSDMTLDIMEHNPTLMIHGHVHNAFDYYVDSTQEICQTRVVCNPRGYINYEVDPELRGFNINLVIDV